MKKRILSALSVLALVAMLLSLPIATFAEGKQVLISASAETELFYEDPDNPVQPPIQRAEEIV